jgi:NADH-quinone oxidoreductase subunit E
MLTEEEKAEIQEEIPHFENKQEVCIDAMKIVQRHRGWVSDESIKDIADFLDMTADELDGVATFYNLIFREPVGKHVILLCNSITCWIMGYERMREQLKTRLGVDFGGTSSDNQFTLLPIVCLGTCDHAPAMMVDSDLHRDLTPEKIDQILDQYRSKTAG